MKIDDILLLTVLLGIGLTCFHMIYDIVHWKAGQVANQRALLRAKEIYKKLHSATRTITRRRLTQPAGFAQF